MSEYARFAEKAWRRLTPTQYAALLDPKTFFSDLGEQAANQVALLARQIEGPDVPGETYFQKVGRLTAAKRAAEEIVRTDWLTPPQDMWEDDDPPLERTPAEMKLWIWTNEMGRSKEDAWEYLTDAECDEVGVFNSIEAAEAAAEDAEIEVAQQILEDWRSQGGTEETADQVLTPRQMHLMRLPNP